MLKLHALTSHTCKRDLVIIKHRFHSSGYGSLITSSIPSRLITVLPTCSFREKIAHCGLDKHSKRHTCARRPPRTLFQLLPNQASSALATAVADVLRVSCLISLAQTAALTTKVMRTQHRYSGGRLLVHFFDCLSGKLIKAERAQRNEAWSEACRENIVSKCFHPSFPTTQTFFLAVGINEKGGHLMHNPTASGQAAYLTAELHK